MSVCMMLYKVLPDVKYNGYYLDFATNKDFNIDDDGFFPIEKKEQELGPLKIKMGIGLVIMILNLFHIMNGVSNKRRVPGQMELNMITLISHIIK